MAEYKRKIAYVINCINQKKSFSKKENGITLVSLVVTVIVLLILAGVSISAIFGENGIYESSENIENSSQKMQTIEIIRLDIEARQLEGDITISVLEGVLEKYGTVVWNSGGDEIEGIYVDDLDGEYVALDDILTSNIVIVY